MAGTKKREPTGIYSFRLAKDTRELAKELSEEETQELKAELTKVVVKKTKHLKQ